MANFKHFRGYVCVSQYNISKIDYVLFVIIKHFHPGKNKLCHEVVDGHKFVRIIWYPCTAGILKVGYIYIPCRTSKIETGPFRFSWGPRLCCCDVKKVRSIGKWSWSHKYVISGHNALGTRGYMPVVVK